LISVTLNIKTQVNGFLKIKNLTLNSSDMYTSIFYKSFKSLITNWFYWLYVHLICNNYWQLFKLFLFLSFDMSLTNTIFLVNFVCIWLDTLSVIVTIAFYNCNIVLFAIFTYFEVYYMRSWLQWVNKINFSLRSLKLDSKYSLIFHTW